MDFLKEKWSLWFNLLDVNKDGKVNREDVDENITRFSAAKKLTGVAAKTEGEKLKRWWEKYILQGQDEMSKEEFIQILEKKHNEHKEHLNFDLRSCAEDATALYYPGKNISLDDYIMSGKVWGNNDEATLKKCFELYKPQHGIVSTEKYIHDWLEFAISEDRSKENHTLMAFKAGYN